MSDDEKKRFVSATQAPARARQNVYPPPFDRVTQGRLKRPLGDLFGLKNFGVNLTELAPGAATALHHRHALQDEFVYVLHGRPTLVTDQGLWVLEPGMCAGFPAGGEAHHVVNESDETALLLEVGDRSVGDSVEYPNDDLAIVSVEAGRDASGPTLRFVHKDGTPYE